MIKQECIGIPDMILLLMIFCFKKIKIKAEIVLSPGGAYFQNGTKQPISKRDKTADFQNGTKQPIFKTEQNECCYSQYAWNLIYLKRFIFVVWYVPFAK